MATRQFELLVWASLCVPRGRGKSLCYAILSYVQTNRDLKVCFLHLRFKSNSAIEQDEASLVHIARRNTLSWDSFTASRVGKTNLYHNLHVHRLWTWQHKVSIPFTWHKIIPNSDNQNRIGRFPDFSSPLAEWKVWLARLPSSPPTYPPLLTSYSTILPLSLLQRCDRTSSVKKAWEVGMEDHKIKSITHPILVIRLTYNGECSQGSYTTQVWEYTYSILQSSQAIPLGLQIDTPEQESLVDQAKGDTSTSRPQLSALTAAFPAAVVMSSITNPYTHRE